MRNFLEILSDIWQAPDGDFYLGEDVSSSKTPQYLINVSLLLNYFQGYYDALDLLLSSQRVVIAYFQERDNQLKGPATIEEELSEHVDRIEFFADMLDKAICRDAGLISEYVKRGSIPNWSFDGKEVRK